MPSDFRPIRTVVHVAMNVSEPKAAGDAFCVLAEHGDSSTAIKRAVCHKCRRQCSCYPTTPVPFVNPLLKRLHPTPDVRTSPAN